MGNVTLASNNGTKLILKDVRHAPYIRLNLISARRLDDEGKQRRVSFSSCPPHRKSELLELVHSDVCGPIKNIDDIDKTEKDDSLGSGNLTDVNSVPLYPSPNPIQDDVHSDVNDDQQDIGDFDAPIDDVVTDQQQAPIAPPIVPLQKSSRNRRSSIRYSSDDYVLLTNEGEPECYEEAMESECKDQWVEAMKDELQSLHDSYTFELVKLPIAKRALKNRWVYRLKQEEKSSSP
ncbi:hypothetical protein V6N11_020043 [Hibiscus sabdariffa]|uniref:Retrovirus-related Pol polyprotein from transposon TNT 1-94 n=1 Tax=Hibiscus sabdariffa TaxID=183260 RepID=A0ABR2P8H0_9ROSI